jgi:cytochrome d ubiquinol oxidase subunit I
VQRTADGVSDVPAGQLLSSLLVFTALYAALAIAEVRLLARHARAEPTTDAADDEPGLELAY